MKLHNLLQKSVSEGLTPYRISKKTGISQSTIGRIMKGSEVNSSTEKILLDFLLLCNNNKNQIAEPTENSPYIKIILINSIADEIKKLNDLKTSGILTEEEYQKAKNKLLND